MTGPLSGLFRGDRPSRLADVAEAETMRDAVDRAEIARDLPPEWSVRSDIVLYGEDLLTDVLVFRHDRTRQEITVMPESNTDPTGPVRFYHHDRNAGLRRRLPVERESLSAGLDYVLDRIERFERTFGDGGTALLPGDP